MKIKLFCLAFVLVRLSSAQYLSAVGPNIVNDKGEKIILRGMGLGGWMLQEGYMLRVNGIGQQQHVIRQHIEELIGKEKTETFYNAWLKNHTRQIDIDSMAAWGFNSIRLPMHYNLYTLPIDQESKAGENTWLERGFAMTDSLLKWCAANKMYLILDLHGAPGGQGNDLNIADRDPSKPSLWQSEANQSKMIALWRKLAQRYASEPWIGGYDIINEPNWGFEKAEDKNGCAEAKNEPLKKLMADITNAIREVDKKHIIIIEGNCWGNNYSGIFPPWDNNTVISFHKYWNYNDQASIQKFVDIRKQYNTPVWLGESGENSNLWYRDAIRLVEKNEIGWTWWPLKKLGYNNPLQVKLPSNYQKILDYWQKKGTKPTTEDAYQGLMEFANNLTLENCIYHKDVVDAMFRQTRSDEVVPFKNTTVKNNTSINAADYDLGRNGFAYYDKDTANYWVANGGKRTDGNKGHAYRNDGVDIFKEGETLFVGSFEAGEWLQYTVSSDSDRSITVNCHMKSRAASNVEVEANGNKSTAMISPAEGWQDIKFKSVQLKKGNNTIRVKLAKGDVDFESMRFGF
ncbi:MAG TPA: cellulase family glycosylhydrolase [Cyclobacteriaceae bacterium]|nr:cellulase family glycosylhydrolase [Cyclobacteriaceae bacterium]